MDAPTNTELDLGHFEQAAQQLGCQVEVVRAIADVESRGQGFVEVRGKLLAILKYEGHIFHREYVARHGQGAVAGLLTRWPSIVYPRWTERFTGNQWGERARFSQAFRLDAQAAMRSCSLGAFQIMGFNHSACGFATVDEWWAAHHRSAEDQLYAFCTFVASQPHMLHAVRNCDFETFARLYNGPAYATHGYHTRMADRFNHHMSA